MSLEASLWSEPADAGRLMEARTIVLMIGGYDGSGNFGDIIQLAGAVRAVERCGWLAVPVLEAEYLDSHVELAKSHPQLFGDACFVFFPQQEGVSLSGSLVELDHAPGAAATTLYLYGGGYMNSHWGARKLQQLAIARRWARATGADQDAPIIATGLQVSPEFLQESSELRALLPETAFFGLRDPVSLHYTREVSSVRDPILTSDDATCELKAVRAPAYRDLPHDGPTPQESPLRVNVHLNVEGYVTEDGDALLHFASVALETLQERAGRPLALRLIIGYHDFRLSERPVAERFIELHRQRLPIVLRDECTFDIVQLIDDHASHDLEVLRSGSLTMSCSYHVALASLLNEVPIVHLRATAYYDHKARGLRDLFGLPQEMFADVAADDPERVGSYAATLATDGARREEIRRTLELGAANAVNARLRAEGRISQLLAMVANESLAKRVERFAGALADERRTLSELRVAHHELMTSAERLTEDFNRQASQIADLGRATNRQADELAVVQSKYAAATSTKAWRLATKFWRLKSILRSVFTFGRRR